MDDVAAAKEQVSFFSQGREGFSYVVGVLRPFDAPVVVDGDVRQQGEDVVGEFLAALGWYWTS